MTTDDPGLALIAQWAHAAGAEHPLTGRNTVTGWSDLDSGLRLDRDGTNYTIVTVERGVDRWTATFERLIDAERFLMLRFGRMWRSQNGRGPLHRRELALGATLAEAAQGLRLRWDVSSGTFASELQAKDFSHVTHLPLAELSEHLKTAP